MSEPFQLYRELEASGHLVEPPPITQPTPVVPKPDSDLSALDSDIDDDWF